MEFDLTRTRVGAITISAAAVSDVVGWLLLAVISALAAAQFSAQATFVQLGWLLLYGAICWWLVRPFLRWLIQRSDLSHDRLPPNLVAIALALTFISGMCTYRIGIFAIFGGFMMGVLIHDQPKFVALWKKTVGDFVLVFFLPIFFTYTGLRTDIIGLDTLALWNWCLILILAATLGKFGGGYVAARLAGLDHHHANTIGIMMNTRGLMELIVLNIGYDLGFLPQNVFTMLVIMAVFTTIVTAPVLRRVLPRIGHAVPRGIDA
jgi:Kef-type K+ transport system membrane component KefB